MSDATEFPGLGFNPAPGKIESVEDLARKINRAFGGLESAHRTLMDIAKGGKTWEGQAANAFSQHVGDLPRSLSVSVDALKQAASQLGSWRSQLFDYQQKARQYEADAKATKERIHQQEAAKERATRAYNQAAADPAFRLAGQVYTDNAVLDSAQAKIDAAQARLRSADNELSSVGERLDSARGELDGIIKKATELLEHHQSDARDIADKLRKANRNAPHTSVFDRMGDTFQRLGHAIKAWCVKHADLLKTIGDWLGNVAGVLGILSLLTMWCPPLSGSLALAGGALSLGSLTAHTGAKLGGAHVGWGELGMDAIGVVPFGKFAKIATIGKTKVALKLGGEAADGTQQFTRSADSATKLGRLDPLVERNIAQSEDVARSGILKQPKRVFTTDGVGNRVKLAWEDSVGTTMGASLKEKGWAKTLEKIPGVKDLDSFKAALRSDGTLDPMSWWSRGPLVGQGSVSTGVSIHRTATGN